MYNVEKGALRMHYFKNLDDQDTRLVACIYVVAGILLCFFEVNIILMGTRILGLVLALLGAYFLYAFFKKRSSTNSSPFFVGLPSVLIGGLMLFSPESVVATLPILVGVLFIISSVLSMQKAFTLKDMGMPTWRIPLGGDVIILIIGVVLLLNPIRSLSFILQLVGLFLIIEGIFVFWGEHLLRKYKKVQMEE